MRSSGGVAGGVDLGGTKVQVAIVAEDGEVLAEGRDKTPVSGGPKAVVETIAGALKTALHQAKLSVGDLEGIGIGTPGAVDPATGTVSGANNLPGFGDPVPLRDLVAKAVKHDGVVVTNDVNAGTLAEFAHGAGKPYDDMLAVFVGTGVGGGLILAGQLREGAFGAAGEIGHMVVVRGGDVCPCGRRGCTEAYAGRGAIEAKARAAEQAGRKTRLFDLQREQNRPRLTSGVIKAALEAGDPLAHELIEQAVLALGAATASAVNLLDVQAVVIGGGLGDKLGHPFVRRVHEAMTPHLFLAPSPVAVLGSKLGDLGGAVGASILARAVASG